MLTELLFTSAVLLPTALPLVELIVNINSRVTVERTRTPTVYEWGCRCAYAKDTRHSSRDGCGKARTYTITCYCIRNYNS
uniref:Putative secreted protein n=1 Tax=Anopheles darlingi TaxID=43151 RepID=A0A2M4D2E5_ANODA